ncbi:MAG TPA: cytochrome C oxidase subunit IV family protein [Terriglobia bacterium]|nr:cytochrome C oxidase subunit IV family protein [Terriglobia bacterium]
MAGHIVPTKIYFTIFAILIAMTGLTTWVATLDMPSPWNTVVALAIAIFKASLVILFFMHVKYSSNLTRAAVVAGFFWLAILMVLTLSDILTRHWIPQTTGWTTTTIESPR